MPIGYLITTVGLAMMALVAIAPPKPDHSSPRNWAFVFGFVINELPFVAIYVLVATTALAAAEGDLFTPMGVVGLAFAVIAIGLLVVVVRRGLATRGHLRGVLDRSRLTTSGRGAQRPMPTRQPWTRILFAPWSYRGRKVRRDANVSYGPAGRRHRLDVYHPEDPGDGRVLVYFHGGAYRSGDKNREAKPLLHRLAREGWVCISANYRLAPGAHFPDQLVDAKRVVAWARQHAADYAGDPARIIVAGSSAGGHLAMTTALTPNRPEFQPDFVEVDTTVAGAISLCGFYGSASDGVGSSPRDFIHPAAPPLFIAHGTNDTLVLVDDARAFADELAAVSTSSVIYAELPGGQHAFDMFRSARFEAVVDAVHVFLDAACPVDLVEEVPRGTAAAGGADDIDGAADEERPAVP